jgi:tRNA1(Val) A37 N6-methylase TrmN6
LATHYSTAGPAHKYYYNGISETISILEGNGDFRSPECVALLSECDIVVSNPPFSLFREYLALLMEHDKKFLESQKSINLRKSILII